MIPHLVAPGHHGEGVRFRRLPPMPEPLTTALPPGHGHVIVCEVEHLGMRTIDELRRRDEDVVAIAPNDDAREDLAALDVRLVVGDPLLARTLRDAGIEDAAAIVMTGADDLTNLNVALVFNGQQQDVAFAPLRRVTLDDYLLLNVAASYRINDYVEVFARGENLLDQEYQEVFSFGTPGIAAYGGLRIRFEPLKLAGLGK